MADRDQPRPTDARKAALEALDRVEKGDRIEEAASRAVADLDRRDGSLAREIIYGVTRHRRLLDYRLRGLIDRPWKKVSPELKNPLRIGAYQLLMLDRVPDRAAVHTAVELLGGKAPKWKRGFVNGVLRGLIRNRESLTLPGRKKDLAHHLEVAYSWPQWLAQRWLGELGAKPAESLMEALNRPPGLCLRATGLVADRAALMTRLTQAGYGPRPGRFSPEAVYPGKGSVPELEKIAPGMFAAQSEPAQLVGRLAAPRPGQSVLDLCAGVGGKTTHLAELMAGRGRIVAVDSSRERVEIGRERTKAIDIIEYLEGDGTDPGLLDDQAFDAVLIDAPCTGSGTIPGRPDLKWRLKAEDPDRMAEIQGKLLRAGADRVKPGGVLVYATCSLFPEENERVVEGFLKERPEFEPDPAGEYLGPEAAELVTEEGYLRTRPNKHGLEGFFAARMVRET